MIAVRVPGRASIEMLSRSVLLPSMVHVRPRTSRPPVRVAASVSDRRVRPPSAKTRSTLPIVTTSPLCRVAASTRWPLTNVPLMLRLSMISAVPEPAADGTNVAWCRDARTSGMTMSLSVARPILTEPCGRSADFPGRRILSMLVARLEPSPDPPDLGGIAVGPIWVGTLPVGAGCGRTPVPDVGYDGGGGGGMLRPLGGYGVCNGCEVLG